MRTAEFQSIPTHESSRLKSAMFCGGVARVTLALVVVLVLIGCESDHDRVAPLDTDAWPGNLVVPIESATFSMAKSQLPDAPRHYRRGTHEGFDFFPGMSGKLLADDEPIVAVADGTVIRIDHEYADEGAEALQFWAEQAPIPGFHGEYALDRLRGRQVWIRHAEGHVSRYAHLSMVHPELALGDTVEQGEVIGLMGNSGVPPTEDQPEPGPHLHFELWLPDGETYLGQGMSALDTHRLLAELFSLESLPRYAQGVVRRVNAGQSPPEEYPPAELPEVAFRLERPRSTAPGQPFAIPITWEGNDFLAEEFRARLDDLPLGIIDASNGAWILGAIPLGLELESLPLIVTTSDPFGQSLLGSAVIPLARKEPAPAPLEVDTVILQKYTEENFSREARHLIPVSRQSLNSSEPLWERPFDAPIDGEIVQHFGQAMVGGMLRPDHPMPGLVVSAEQGTHVLASNAGVVGLVRDLPVRGRTVAVIHGSGVVSIYSHLQEALINPGDPVSQGQIIGFSGQSGAATAPSLRWEMLIGKIPTDPIAWLDQMIPGSP